MNVQLTNRRRSPEAGVAMLIAIFVLLLIAVVGIALIVSSGTETALAGNYRSSTVVYYAALAGLEEARGRLLPKNPNSFNATIPAPLFPPNVFYITNPANGENVLATYPDQEYGTEFPLSPVPTILGTIPSVSTVAGIQGQLYRWVRINGVTEKSLNIDVANNGMSDPGPLYFDGAHLTPTPTGNQALEITSLAFLPNGTKKLLQYVVAPIALSPNFPAVLTLLGSPGNNVQFTSPGHPDFIVNGNDEYAAPGCTPGSTPVYAIGYGNGSNASGINTSPPTQYIGAGSTPSISDVTASLPSSFQSVQTLNALIQNIMQSADVELSPAPPATMVTGSALPTTMSASNPMTVVVNGDLNLTGWNGTGYGLLVVTGTLTYDPGPATWDGIVLVVGKGNYVSTTNGFGLISG